MRRKSLWKNLMLATALTVVLGTAPVTAFAADVDSTVTETEQTAPEPVVPQEEVSVKATAPTINATASPQHLTEQRMLLLLYNYI